MMAEPTDEARAKAKKALGELGEVTTAVEAVAQLLVEECHEAHSQGFAAGAMVQAFKGRSR